MPCKLFHKILKHNTSLPDPLGQSRGSGNWTELVQYTDRVPSPSWISAPDGSFVHFNPAWIEFRGQNSAQNFWTQDIHPEDRPLFLETFQNALLSGTGNCIQFRILDQNGNYRRVQGTITPLIKDKALLGCLGSCIEIIDSPLLPKQKLETLEKEKQDLEIKLSEYSQLLFLKSRQAAMGEMMGYVAHQWKQPLNVIGLCVQNIQEHYNFGQLDEGFLSKTVDKTNELVRNMFQTIDEFLDFFKPKKDCQEFEIHEAVQKVLSLCGPSFKYKNIEISFNSSLSQTHIPGSPNEFSQVILNLLNNARETILERKIENGKIEIRISENENLIITVSDNGGGIAPEIMPRIFESYFTTRPQGTGIGLYLCKLIVEEKMKGGITVSNTPLGAEFRIVLPLGANQN